MNNFDVPAPFKMGIVLGMTLIGAVLINKDQPNASELALGGRIGDFIRDDPAAKLACAGQILKFRFDFGQIKYDNQIPEPIREAEEWTVAVHDPIASTDGINGQCGSNLRRIFATTDVHTDAGERKDYNVEFNMAASDAKEIWRREIQIQMSSDGISAGIAGRPIFQPIIISAFNFFR